MSSLTRLQKTTVTLSADELVIICNAMDEFSSEQFPYRKLRHKLNTAGSRARLRQRFYSPIKEGKQ